MLNPEETDTLSLQSEGGRVSGEATVCLLSWPSRPEGPEYRRESLASHGASLRPRNRAACGRRMGRGWYICPAVLPHTRGIPTQHRRTCSPARGRTGRPAPVPALALCDPGLAFCIHKTGGQAPFMPALPASTSTEPGSWGRGCPDFTLPWALLECEQNFLHPQWNPGGFCPRLQP